VSSLDIWVGVDIGSSSCKAIAFDSDMRTLDAARQEYPMLIRTNGWAEHDPCTILRAVIAVIKQVLISTEVMDSCVRGIGFSGFMHSVMGVDRELNPLTPCLAWADLRTTQQVDDIRAQADATELYRRTGCPLHTTYVPAKLRWLRDNMAGEFGRAWRFMSVKEWVIANLTGVFCCDLGVASGSGLLNIHDLGWDPLVLDVAGITPDRLSQLVEPSTILPGMATNLASSEGLPGNIPVVIGSSDAALSSIGAGGLVPCRMAAMVGTSAAVRALDREPRFDAGGRSWCYYAGGGYWVVGGAANNGGNVLRWFRDEFGASTYEQLSREAELAPPGSGGLLFLPFMAGERAPNWNADARGVFFGLNLGHSRRHLVRAIMEGIMFQVTGIYEVVSGLCGIPSSLRATGGFARSGVWLSIMASVSGVPLDTLPDVEGSATGAAALARTALLGLHGMDWIDECIRPTGRVEPDPSDSQVYRDLYYQYMRIYRLLKDEFAAIAEYQRYSLLRDGAEVSAPGSGCCEEDTTCR